MRALAATSVLAYHSWAISSPSGQPVSLGPFNGYVSDLSFGVTLFFTLSGFLLYRPFARSVLQGEPLPRIAGYLRNRALRILPAYWVILLIAAVGLQTVLVRSGTHLRPHALHGEGLGRAATFTQNYTPSTLGSGIGPAWSLAVEAVFYLILPLLALSAAVLAGPAGSAARRRLAAFAPPVALLAVGLSGKAAAAFLVPGPHNAWNNDWHSVIELSFWGQADLFAFGMALAVLYAEVAAGAFALPRLWRPTGWLVVIGGYALVRVAAHPDEQLSYSPSNTVMAVVCTALLGLVVLQTAERRSQTLLLRILEIRPVVWVGVVSYSVFLWHGPIVRWLVRHGLVVGGQAGLVANTLLLLALTLTLSALTYRFVEAPALRLKARGRQRVVPAAQVSAAP